MMMMEFFVASFYLFWTPSVEHGWKAMSLSIITIILSSPKFLIKIRFQNLSMFFDGIGIGFEKFWYQKKYRYRFQKNLVSKKVSVPVSENFGFKKSIGIGFKKNWYRKKYRYQFRKILVSKKVLVSKILILK